MKESNETLLDTTKTDAPSFKSMFTTGIPVKRAQLHQGFQITNAGMETTLADHRTKGIRLRACPQFLVVEYKGEYMGTPNANVIVCYE